MLLFPDGRRSGSYSPIYGWATHRVALDELISFAWSAPMRDLAAQVEMSDVGLKKLLKSCGVTTPPQGHWNRVKAGRRVEYADVPGFACAASHDTIAGHGDVLTAGRYVGAEDVEADAVPFAQRFATLQATLEEQCVESARLTDVIRQRLVSVIVPAE